MLTTIVVAVGAWFQAQQTAHHLKESKAADYARQDAVAAAQAAKLEQIHTLVNSTLTGQMEEAHGALLQQLVLMREVLALHTAAGRQPSPAALEAIEIIQKRVDELGTRLADRAKATQIADENVAAAA